ncbi:MAG: bifunctional oligoribonuclease/PAP phosphatase NrnA [Syntrophales bacterium]|nr:bifunctional oligoribonuclease/PAP phosphatase NrnA [Syntrophales bacterium]
MVLRIIDIINSCQVFLITSHVRLDGDALGSELALYHMLRYMKREAVVYNQDKTPQNYRFLPGSDAIVHQLPPVEKFEAAFVLDCSELERVGEEANKIRQIKRIIAIDHHISRGGFCEIAYIDHQASSTGELLYRLAEQMSLELTAEMATNLYAAIMTDTGGFRYGSTRHSTLIAAGNLLEKGANPQWIAENIYESKPLAKIKLLKKVLETLTFDSDGKIGSMVVLQKTIESVRALPEHTEGFVDIPRSIEGVEISILYNELSENYFKISFRSKGKINVERIARAFGGGGHTNASGCEVEGDIETIRHRVRDVIKACVK